MRSPHDVEHPGTREGEQSIAGVALRVSVLFAVLIALLLTTLASAFWTPPRAAATIGLAVAAIKTLLVAIFFMQLRNASKLTIVIAVVGLLMLAILGGLSFTDVATRAPDPAAWQVPQQLRPAIGDALPSPDAIKRR